MSAVASLRICCKGSARTVCGLRPTFSNNELRRLQARRLNAIVSGAQIESEMYHRRKNLSNGDDTLRKKSEKKRLNTISCKL